MWRANRCGGRPIGQVPISLPATGQICNDNFVTVECVIEPTINCAPNIFNHFRRVEHIVPVQMTNIHNFNTQHDFIVQKQLQVENVQNSNVAVVPFNAMPVANVNPIPVPVATPPPLFNNFNNVNTGIAQTPMAYGNGSNNAMGIGTGLSYNNGQAYELNTNPMSGQISYTADNDIVTLGQPPCAR